MCWSYRITSGIQGGWSCASGAGFGFSAFNRVFQLFMQAFFDILKKSKRCMKKSPEHLSVATAFINNKLLKPQSIRISTYESIFENVNILKSRMPALFEGDHSVSGDKKLCIQSRGLLKGFPISTKKFQIFRRHFLNAVFQIVNAEGFYNVTEKLIKAFAARLRLKENACAKGGIF